MMSFRSVCLASAVFVACRADAALAQAPSGAAPPPPAVTVQTIQPRTIPITYEYAGRVVASREVEVRARVGGILLERTFEEGSRVTPNQVLFRIDANPYEAEVALARAQLLQQQATLGQARRTEERNRALAERGATSTATLDDAVSSRELAEAQVAGAQAQLQTANLSLEYATVKAPVGGITSLEQVPEGSLLSVNTLLTRISQLDPIYINFSAADTEAAAIRRLIDSGAAFGSPGGPTVEVTFGDGSVYPQKGTIDFTSSSIDTDTGTILSRAILPNPGNQLLPGQFVRVKISGLSLESAMVIPSKALMQGPQGTFVYTLDEKGLAKISPIRISRAIDNDIVVGDGLKSGDRVVTEGVIKVRPNAPVKETPASDMPASSSAPAPAASDSGGGTGKADAKPVEAAK